MGSGQQNIRLRNTNKQSMPQPSQKHPHHITPNCRVSIEASCSAARGDAAGPPLIAPSVLLMQEQASAAGCIKRHGAALYTACQSDRQVPKRVRVEDGPAIALVAQTLTPLSPVACTATPHLLPLLAQMASVLDEAAERKELTAACVDTAAAMRQAADEVRRRATAAWEAAGREETSARTAAAVAAQEWTRTLAAGRGASIAQRCYQDALHEIYAFLSLRELLPAAHSCRAWYAAAGKEKGRNLTCRRSRYDFLRQLCSSPLRRHVVGVDYGCLLSPRHLQQLALHLPHLQALRASVNESALRPLVNSAAACLAFVQSGFPLHLRCLVLQMALSVETCQLVLNSLPTASALTRLKLNLVMKWSRRLVLMPLLRLPLLAELSISIDSAALTPCHLSVIKQMKTLRWLDLHRGGMETGCPTAGLALQTAARAAAAARDPPARYRRQRGHAGGARAPAFALQVGAAVPSARCVSTPAATVTAPCASRAPEQRTHRRSTGCGRNVPDGG